jgi:hypothetical protein
MRKQSDFDLMYRAIFEGVKNPEFRYQRPNAWRGS